MRDVSNRNWRRENSHVVYERPVFPAGLRGVDDCGGASVKLGRDMSKDSALGGFVDATNSNNELWHGRFCGECAWPEWPFYPEDRHEAPCHIRHPTHANAKACPAFVPQEGMT